MRRHLLTSIERLEHRVMLATNDQVVFVDDDDNSVEQIFIANSDGTGQFMVPTTASDPANPAFTPDRTRIVFEADDDNQEIWIIGEDGSGETRLTNNAAEDRSPEVSPDGQRIVFVSDRDGNDNIFSMDLTGGDVRRLTNSPGTDRAPAFSPDGSKIIFSTNRYSGNYEIVTIDAATGENLTRLTNSAESDESPTYSPDGSRIAWVSSRSGKAEIWTMAAAGEFEGATPVRLTEVDQGGTRAHTSPSYSPDGTLIAYVATDSGLGEVRVIESTEGFVFETFGEFARGVDWAAAPRFTALIGSTMMVYGTAGNDNIVIGYDADSEETTVTRNGVTEGYFVDWVMELQIFCGDGKDTVLGDASPVKFYASGDAGDDVMVGGNFNDTLTAGAGRNTLFGGNGNDRLNGSSGRDFLYGDGGDDRIYGNAGNDYMLGGGNIDRIWGGAGDDFIAGNGQNDKLFGEDGNDQIYGNDGNDILYGGLNIDILNGGKGEDSADDDDGDTRFAIETVG